MVRRCNIRYLGGKSREAAKILKIVLKDRTPDQPYIEPFVGGCNVIDKVAGPRWGNDFNADLIIMWRAVQRGWTPPQSITEDEYRELKNDPYCTEPALRAFVSFAGSWGGKEWGGYARGEGRNFIDEGRRAILKQAPLLQGVTFTSGPYDQMLIPMGSIVYCDPPYAGTTKYRTGDWDPFKFWSWVRTVSRYSKVFVSEFTAPDDFDAVLTFERKNDLNKAVVTEKLYTLRGTL